MTRAKTLGAGPRLPAEGAYRWLAGPLGRIVARPWFDAFAFGAITYGMLPLSRAWAAAVAAGGSSNAFMAAFPGRFLPRPLVVGALSRVEKHGRAYRAAHRRWEESAFAPLALSEGSLAALETGRSRAAHRFMATRVLFLPAIAAFPKLRLEIATPQQVEQNHGARLASAEDAFPLPGPVTVKESQAVRGPRGPVRWLRFPSSVLGDTAWARVEGPASRPGAPTVVSLHGITIESEMWRGLRDPLTDRLGIDRLGPEVRVIRPEAPWHGRRRLEGWYGGEPLLAWGPLGLISGFAAALAEIAALIAWARRQGEGPVILAGVSLGALTAQLYATVSRAWPKELVPDALFLATVSGDVKQVALDGCLARALGLRAALEAAGWSEARIEPWLPLIEPQGPPALAPERIFMLLGRHDCVMPPEGGRALARAWRLPEGNLFQRPQGHFSVPLGLIFDPSPWRAIFERLGVTP